MFKLFETLLRGQAARAAEEIFDRNALLILDQQIRETRAGLERAGRRSPWRWRATGRRRGAWRRRRRASPRWRRRRWPPSGAGARTSAGRRPGPSPDLEAERDALTAARARFAAEIGASGSASPRRRGGRPSWSGAGASPPRRRRSAASARAPPGRTPPPCARPRRRWRGSARSRPRPPTRRRRWPRPSPAGTSARAWSGPASAGGGILRDADRRRRAGAPAPTRRRAGRGRRDRLIHRPIPSTHPLVPILRRHAHDPRPVAAALPSGW